MRRTVISYDLSDENGKPLFNREGTITPEFINNVLKNLAQLLQAATKKAMEEQGWSQLRMRLKKQRLASFIAINLVDALSTGTKTLINLVAGNSIILGDFLKRFCGTSFPLGPSGFAVRVRFETTWKNLVPPFESNN